MKTPTDRWKPGRGGMNGESRVQKMMNRFTGNEGVNMSNQGNFAGRIRDNWRQRAAESTTFRAELRVIPRWLIRVLFALYLSAVAGVVCLGIFAPEMLHTFRGAPPDQKVLVGLVIVTLIMVVLSALVSLFGYIAADAKRRGMSPVLWLLVALLVPYLIGVLLYFVVREPLHLSCPQCGRKVNPHFNFCPGCQFNLRPNCPQCRRTISVEDRFCPYCGSDLQADTPPQQVAPTT